MITTTQNVPMSAYRGDMDVSQSELDFIAQQNPEDYEAWDIPEELLDPSPMETPRNLSGNATLSGMGEDRFRGFQTFEPEDPDEVYRIDRAYDPHADIRDETWDWECGACGRNAAWVAFNRAGDAPINWKPGLNGSNSLCCGAPLNPVEASSAVLIEWNAA